MSDVPGRSDSRSSVGSDDDSLFNHNEILDISDSRSSVSSDANSFFNQNEVLDISDSRSSVGSDENNPFNDNHVVPDISDSGSSIGSNADHTPDASIDEDLSNNDSRSYNLPVNGNPYSGPYSSSAAPKRPSAPLFNLSAYNFDPDTYSESEAPSSARPLSSAKRTSSWHSEKSERQTHCDAHCSCRIQLDTKIRDVKIQFAAFINKLGYDIERIEKRLGVRGRQDSYEYDISELRDCIQGLEQRLDARTPWSDTSVESDDQQ
jgi:hypothetical protein